MYLVIFLSIDKTKIYRLQVLQDSVPDGNKVAALFGESDTLRSQLSVYQRDREQLINALTAKHQESVGFYEEAQRLAARVSELSVKLEQRAQAHDLMAQQYEEKQRALYTALNELSTLRQRRSELERLLAATRSAEVSKDANSRVSFSVDSDEGDDDEDVSDRPSKAVLSEKSAQDMRLFKDAITEKELAISERDQRIGNLEQAIADRERLVEERQQEFIDGAAKLRQMEDLMSARNSELTVLRKQCESLAFDLQGANGDRSELSGERDMLRRNVEALSVELQTLRLAHDELAAAFSKKEYELGVCREQASSLEKLVASAGGEGQQHDGQVEMLSSQLEVLRRQLQALQLERDAAHQELRHHQTEHQELRNKVCAQFFCSICLFTPPPPLVGFLYRNHSLCLFVGFGSL